MINREERYSLQRGEDKVRVVKNGINVSQDYSIISLLIKIYSCFSVCILDTSNSRVIDIFSFK